MGRKVKSESEKVDKVISVRLYKHQEDYILEKVEKSERSIGYVVRWIIDDYIRTHP